MLLGEALSSRRAAVAAASLFLSSLPLTSIPLASVAAERGGVQWAIELPKSFVIQRQLASIVRVKVETVLAAEDPVSGVQAKLLLIPFGQQAAGSLNSEEQLTLARYLLADGDPGDVASKAELEEVVTTMTNSAARSPSVLSLKQVGASGVDVAENRRYVRYQYVVERCLGDIDDGECFGGSARRRNLATVALSSISQYRTNTERERMKELGQARNVDVLWLLTLSAPEARWNEVYPQLEKVARTFKVPQQMQ